MDESRSHYITTTDPFLDESIHGNCTWVRPTNKLSFCIILQLPFHATEKKQKQSMQTRETNMFPCITSMARPQTTMQKGSREPLYILGHVSRGTMNVPTAIWTESQAPEIDRSNISAGNYRRSVSLRVMDSQWVDRRANWQSAAISCSWPTYRTCRYQVQSTDNFENCWHLGRFDKSKRA